MKRYIVSVLIAVLVFVPLLSMPVYAESPNLWYTDTSDFGRIGGVSLSFDSDQIFTVDGTVSQAGGAFFKIGDFADFVPGDWYALSYYPVSGDFDDALITVGLFAYDGSTMVNYRVKYVDWPSRANAVFEIGNGDYSGNLYLGFSFGNKSVFDNHQFRVKLSKGKTYGDWTPADSGGGPSSPGSDGVISSIAESVDGQYSMPVGYVLPEFKSLKIAEYTPSQQGFICFDWSSGTVYEFVLGGSDILTLEVPEYGRGYYLKINSTSARPTVYAYPFVSNVEYDYSDMYSSVITYESLVKRVYYEGQGRDGGFYRYYVYNNDVVNTSFSGYPVGDTSGREPMRVIPIAVRGSGNIRVKYSNGTYYNGEANNYGFKYVGDAIPGGVNQRLPLNILTSWLAYIGQEMPLGGSGGLSGEIGEVGSDIGDMVGEFDGYENMANDATGNISTVIASAQPIFTGVWGILPGWFLSLMAVVLVIVIARKAVGR